MPEKIFFWRFPKKYLPSAQMAPGTPLQKNQYFSTGSIQYSTPAVMPGFS